MNRNFAMGCIACLLLGLNACAVNQAPESTDMAASNQASFGSTNFFLQFSDQLDTDSTSAFRSRFDVESVKRHIEKKQLSHTQDGFIRSPWPPIISSVFESWFLQLQLLEGDWHFIGTQSHGKMINSYFVLELEEGFNYIDIIWSVEEQKIVDIRPMMYEFSVLENLLGIDSLVENDETARKNQWRLLSAFRAINDDHADKVVRHLQLLPKKLATHPLLVERLLKQYEVSNSPTWLGILNKQLDPKQVEHSKFAAWHLANNRPLQAITSLKNSHAAILNHYGIQLELAVIYLEDEKLDQANDWSNQAILSDPYEDTPYLIKMVVALKQFDHEGTALTLAVLRDRFNTVFTAEDMKTLEKGEDFATSEYAQIYFKSIESLL